MEKIDELAFSNCALKALDLSKCNKLKCIAFCTFEYCTNLELVILPDSIEKLEDFAFSKCKSLKEIHIPHGIKYVTREVFSFYNDGCKLIYDGSEEDWKKVKGCWPSRDNGNLEIVYLR